MPAFDEENQISERASVIAAVAAEGAANAAESVKESAANLQATLAPKIAAAQAELAPTIAAAQAELAAAQAEIAPKIAAAQAELAPKLEELKAELAPKIAAARDKALQDPNVQQAVSTVSAGWASLSAFATSTWREAVGRPSDAPARDVSDPGWPSQSAGGYGSMSSSPAPMAVATPPAHDSDL